MKKIYFIAIIAILFFASCHQSEQNSKPKKAKYVFYFIGDGMGMSHVNLTQAYIAARKDEIGVDNLIMTQFPVYGMATTFAEDRYITGSAAAGTALATGHKTSIGTIGMKSNHTDNLNSIAYYAKQSGMKIGILSSVGINHATPAAFYAHQPKRSNYYEIALELSESNFDFFGGGGFINPKGRNDSLPDIYEITKKNGYSILRTNAEFQNLTPSAEKVMLISPVILEDGELPYSIDQKQGFFKLADFTQKGIEYLENDNGFFIMVEGGKIDWAAHANDGGTVVNEIIDFDMAVYVAYQFYLKHPDETLIVVTADHETGGLGVGWRGTHYDNEFTLLTNQKQSLAKLSENLNAFISSNQPFTIEKMYKFGSLNLSLEKLTSEDSIYIEENFLYYQETQKEEEGTYENSNILAYTWLQVLNKNAGIGWTTGSHTGTPVPVFAIGAGSEKFNGYYDNTDIPKKIAESIGIKME